MFPIAGLTSLFAATGVIVSVPPGNFLLETIVLAIIGLSLWLICLTFVDRKKAGLISLGIVLIVILNRFGVLEPLTLLLLAVVIAGIWLV